MTETSFPASDLTELVETISMTENVRPFLVPQTHTIRQAMEQLERTEEKIIFVIDSDSCLVGSLTDGDIRRWILSDGDLKASVSRVCNASPRVVEEGFDVDELRAEMLNHNLGCVPVVNGVREIVKLVFWKELFQRSFRVRAKIFSKAWTRW